ncbi:MAG: DJ-1/PfpI family protein [Kiritimatiellae bacterium]|nr:DJ-1/PfpI family protein [Kiritimatiellia bacterium]
MSNALVILAEGFEDVEAVTSIDVLRRGGVDVVSAALGDSLEVESAHGIKMRADAFLKDAAGDEYDVVLLPGGPGTENLKKSGLVSGILRRQKDSGRLIAAICAAPTVLVEAGVLANEHITCYPSCRGDLDRPCAGVPVVADGQIITGEAPGASLLFALVVLQAIAGDTVARKVARGMVTDVL